jgi:hypothetical protein
MKTQKLVKRLKFKKETVSNLDMRNVKGGYYSTLFSNPICPDTKQNCPGTTCTTVQSVDPC